MKIEAFNVPHVGASQSFGTSTLLNNLKNIGSVILNTPVAASPYTAAFNTSYNNGFMDLNTVQYLMQTIQKFAEGNDRTVSEGYSAIMGSYLAGYLEAHYDRSYTSNDDVTLGVLSPFLGVYAEIAYQKKDRKMLNTKEVCEYFCDLCASISYIPSDYEAFALTWEEIQSAEIMPRILDLMREKSYHIQHIPTDSNRDPMSRDFLDSITSSLEKDLLSHDNDAEYVASQIPYVTEAIIYMTDTYVFLYKPTLDRLAEETYREINEILNEKTYAPIAKYIPIEVAKATQGFLIETLMSFSNIGYYPQNEVGYKKCILENITDENFKEFMKELVEYFKRDFYPDYLRHHKGDSGSVSSFTGSNNQCAYIFNGVFRTIADLLVQNWERSRPYTETDYLNRFVERFWSYFTTYWAKNFNSIDFGEVDALTVDSSEEYLKYLISFADKELDELKNAYEEEDNHPNAVYSPMNVNPWGIAIEGKNSIKYQEKQGSRIGSNISKAFQNAKEGAVHIISQFKKISSAVYKWITSDTKNQDKIVLDGRKFTFPGLIKRILLSYGLFHVNIVAGVCAWVFLWAKQKKANKASRRKMIMMLQEEIQMTEEKIQDAAADGDRKAKYALMRSKNQLQNALNKLKYGYGVDLKDEEQPAVRKVTDRALSGGKIAPDDSLRTARSGGRS